MLYLSPSWGAAGIFFAGTGLGASISSPTTQNTASCKGSVSPAAGVGVGVAGQPKPTDGANLGVAGGVRFRFALLFFLIAIFLLHIGNFALLFLAFLL